MPHSTRFSKITKFMALHEITNISDPREQKDMVEVKEESHRKVPRKK